MAQTERAGARDTLARLRQSIAEIERDGALPKRGVAGDHAGFGAPLPGAAVKASVSGAFLATGHADFDSAIGGGLARGALTELHGRTGRDAGVLTGFLAGLLARDEMACPVLWIASPDTLGEAGMLYGHGFAALGFPPHRLLLAQIHHLTDALWVAEEAARTDGLAATVLDMRGMVFKVGLRETRRLHRRAQESGQPVFLLRHGSGREEPVPATTAPVRLMVGPARSAEVRAGLRPDAVAVPGAIGPPGFAVTIDKNKAGPAGKTYILHWNKDERCFDSLAGTCDRRIVRPVHGIHGAAADDHRQQSTGSDPHPVRLFADVGDGQDHAGTGRKRLAG